MYLTGHLPGIIVLGMAMSSPAVSMPWTHRHVADTIRRAMSDYQEGVGRRLFALRKSRDLSQEDAAHLVGVGVKTWHLWERGKTAPYDQNWRKIGEAFNVDTAELRGTPPAPLALGDGEGDGPDQLDRIEADVSVLRDELAELRQAVTALAAVVELAVAKLPREESPAKGQTRPRRRRAKPGEPPQSDVA